MNIFCLIASTSYILVYWQLKRFVIGNGLQSYLSLHDSYQLSRKLVCFYLVYYVSDYDELLLLLQALDTFNLAIVSPIYYVMFTTLTIVASGIMFKVETSADPLVNEAELGCLCNLLGLSWNYEMQDWAGQSLSSIASELCGLITILSGTILLHTAEEGANNSAGLSFSSFFFLQNISCSESVRPFVEDC